MADADEGGLKALLQELNQLKPSIQGEGVRAPQCCAWDSGLRGMSGPDDELKPFPGLVCRHRVSGGNVLWEQIRPFIK